MGSIYEGLARPILFRQDAEVAHEQALQWMQWLQRVPPLVKMTAGMMGAIPGRPVELWGLRFRNSVGVAAGFDKEATVWPSLFALGFGHVEVGTVTRFPQSGNERPRVFRIPEAEALINRMGFPNDGAETVARRLQQLRQRYPKLGPVGVNIGKSRGAQLDEADEDYVGSFKTLAPHADYIAINVSSPNTPNLRHLQSREALEHLLGRLRQVNQGELHRPLLLKIAPDLSFRQIDDVLGVCERQGVDGIIATNTTIARPSEVARLDEKGGMSGRPLLPQSTEVVRYIHRATSGKLPIIGVGGVMDAASAGRLVDAGASLVQVYTGLVYRGPFIARQVARALSWQQRHWV